MEFYLKMNKVLEIVCLIFISRVRFSEEMKHNVSDIGMSVEHWNYDYCDIRCNGTLHTMCQYPAGGGDSCINNLKVYLTRSEKVYIEDNLNRIRLLVALGQHDLPKASNMMKLVWDRELSTIAKRWADQCKEPKHDKCRETMDEVDTGQTVYIGTYDKYAKGPEARMTRIKAIVEIWEKESKLFDKAWLTHYNASTEDTAGNFTQIIWGTTEFVGCGYTEFQMINNVEARFVCNFKRRGNIAGAKVYRVGEPCSMCPSRTVCSETYRGMCWNKKFGNYVDMPDDDGASLKSSVSLLVSLLLSYYISRELW